MKGIYIEHILLSVVPEDCVFEKFLCNIVTLKMIVDIVMHEACRNVELLFCCM